MAVTGTEQRSCLTFIDPVAKRRKGVGLRIVKGQRSDPGDLFLDPKTDLIAAAVMVEHRPYADIRLFFLAHDTELQLLGAGRTDQLRDLGRIGNRHAVDLGDDIPDLQSRIIARTADPVFSFDLFQTDDQNAFHVHFDPDRLSAGDQHVFTDDLDRFFCVFVMTDAEADAADQQQYKAE